MLGELTTRIRDWISEDGIRQLVQAHVRTCVEKKRLAAADDGDGTRYLQADAWDLFPLPDRELSLGEKYTILAVIHDHNSTYGLINPWQSLFRTLKSEDKERRVEFGRMASAEDHGECETCSDDADSRSDHQLAVMYFTLGESIGSLKEGQLNDLGELLEDVRRSTATEEQSQRQKPQVRTKKTTSKGDAQIKIIGALSSHHQFDGDECLNLEPIGNNELARLGEVSKASASLFFRKQFASGDSTSGEGLRKYRGACRSGYTLSLEIKRIRDELIPTELWNSLPVDHEDDAGETATDE